MRLLHVVSDVPTNRVITEDFKYIRWSDEPLRYLHSSINFSENLRIPKGTTTPDFWSLK